MRNSIDRAMAVSQQLGQPYPVQICIWASVILLSVGMPLPEGFPGAALTLSFLLTSFATLLIVTESRPGFISTRVLLAVVVAVYGTLAFIAGPCTDGALRVISSAGSFVILIWSIRRLARIVRFDAPLLPIKHVQVMLALVVIFVGIDVIRDGFTADSRAAGFYREPSHLALAVCPLLFYLWKVGRRIDKLFMVICTTIFVIFSYSSTLLVLLLMLFLIDAGGGLFQRGQRVSAIVGFLGVVILVMVLSVTPLLTPTIARITGVVSVGTEENISSLVYLNGWQLLLANLESSNGVGLGFNAMGCEPRPFTFAMGLLDKYEHADLNYNDGSFLLAKIGSELGYFGIVLWLVSLWLTISLAIRHYGFRHDTRILCYAWISVISVGGVVRSTGYFTGTVTLGLLAMFVALRCFRLPSTTTSASEIH